MTGHRWRHSWSDPLESGLVVALSDVPASLRRIRDAFDPYAKISVPPHITALFPFIPPERLSADDVRAVQEVASRVPQFTFKLTSVESFDDSIFYLAPTPSDPFIALTEALYGRFPEYPPFGGVFETIVPHMSIAHASFGATREAVEALIAADLPIAGTAEALSVMVEDEDGWTVRTQLPFTTTEGPSSRR